MAAMQRPRLLAGLLAVVAAACLIMNTVQPSAIVLAQESLYIVPQANVLTGIGQRPGGQPAASKVGKAPAEKAPHADRAHQQSLYIVPQVLGRGRVSALGCVQF